MKDLAWMWLLDINQPKPAIRSKHEASKKARNKPGTDLNHEDSKPRGSSFGHSGPTKAKSKAE